jgi:hypothetical protein
MPISLHTPAEHTCLRAVATVVADASGNAACVLTHRRRTPVTLVLTMHDPGPQETMP